MKIKFTIFLILVSLTGLGQTITPISDSNFENSKFDNLQFLKDELKNVKLIGLGESAHFMGGTYKAKIKIIKYLHEECGFDVLAFESPMYNLSKINTLLEKDSITTKDLRHNISGVWNTKEMEELFSYIIETRKTKNPLIYAGFDESIFAPNNFANIIKDYKQFIDSLEKTSKVKFELDSLFYNKMEEVVKKCYSFSKRSVEDTLMLNQKFKHINTVLKDVNYESNNYFNCWKHITDNLQSIYRKNYKVGNRDLQMANNTIFLAENLYPSKKIMLWAATTHLLYNPLEIEKFQENPTYERKKMGVFLRERFKEKYYLMAFTSLQGKAGFKGYWGLGKTSIRTTKGSIEKHIDKQLGVKFHNVIDAS